SQAEAASKATRDREVEETKARMVEFNRDRDPNDMPAMRLVHTRLDDAPTDIEEQQHRMAAGAETLDPEEGYGSLIDAITEQFNPQLPEEEEEVYGSIFDTENNTQGSQSPYEEEEEYGSIYDIDTNSPSSSDSDQDWDDENYDGMRLVDHL
ncbi:MAG: hypothetical protein ACWA5W_01695, partial [Phycisphaerales bacterium]